MSSLKQKQNEPLRVTNYVSCEVQGGYVHLPLCPDCGTPIGELYRSSCPACDRGLLWRSSHDTDTED